MKVPEKQIRRILEAMDGFKCAIINQDSVEDLIQAQEGEQLRLFVLDWPKGGFPHFCDEFVATCLKDANSACLI
jgi:hypothetical protein